MQKVDAKKEIDEIFGHLSDVVHYIGTAKVTDRGGETLHVAFARLVFAQDAQLQPWPEKLIYKPSVEVGTGIEMFSIYEPGRYLEPLLTTEWGDSCGAFMAAAQELGVFMVEIVTPTLKRSAIVFGEQVKNMVDRAITPEEYAFLSNAYIEPRKAASS